METGRAEAYDRVLVVDCPEEAQIARLMARDGASREQAEEILAAQVSREERLNAAHDVIENTGTLADLRALRRRSCTATTRCSRRSSALAARDLGAKRSPAFGVHFLRHPGPVAGAAALVFLVWFPDPFQKMLGGTTLFEIMVLCDLGLGPLSSFIVYNSKKSRRALLFDYTIIGVIQLAAFIYGVYAVANNRPAYIVFVGDRFEVISAGEIDDADLAQGGDRYSKRPQWGPQLVAIREARMSRSTTRCCSPGWQGKDYSVLPAYYVPYEQKLCRSSSVERSP